MRIVTKVTNRKLRFEHPPPVEWTRMRPRYTDLFPPGPLFCGYSQEPDQHSKQDQCTQKRKPRVQRMKLKHRTARKTLMPCRQHETSLVHARRSGNRQSSSPYFPTFTRRVPALVILLPISVTSANPLRSQRFRSSMTAEGKENPHESAEEQRVRRK